jgi:hypothetical protein
MQRKQERVSAGLSFAVMLALLSGIALEQGMIESPKWYFLLWITIPMLAIHGWLYRRSNIKDKRKNWYSITKEQHQ